MRNLDGESIAVNLFLFDDHLRVVSEKEELIYAIQAYEIDNVCLVDGFANFVLNLTENSGLNVRGQLLFECMEKSTRNRWIDAIFTMQVMRTVHC